MEYLVKAQLSVIGLWSAQLRLKRLRVVLLGVADYERLFEGTDLTSPGQTLRDTQSPESTLSSSIGDYRTSVFQHLQHPLGIVPKQ